MLLTTNLMLLTTSLDFDDLSRILTTSLDFDDLSRILTTNLMLLTTSLDFDDLSRILTTSLDFDDLSRILTTNLMLLTTSLDFDDLSRILTTNLSFLFQFTMIQQDALESLVASFISTAAGHVIITAKLPPRTQALVDSCFPSQNQALTIYQWKHNKRPTRLQLLEMVKGANGILCMLTDKIDLELIEAAGPQLKIVSTMSVGYDHINITLLSSRNILVGNTPGVLTNATADIASLLVLTASRRAKEGLDAVVNRKWGSWDPNWLLGAEFTGKTLGIVGLGRIGAATAARLIPFGFSKILYSGSKPHSRTEQLLSNIAMAVSSFNNSYSPCDSSFSINFVPTDTLFSDSDVVVLCCALNDATHHLVNCSNISLFKHGAILVNPARGPIVNPEALLAGLCSGRIFAAGLDVTHIEPLTSDHPLALHPRCFILPHLGSATIQTREAMSDLALANLASGLLGKKLYHQVSA
ncbi:hypothetical protein BB561_005194 [Smittium simulii]|uniref:D-isomer specific 2-hydroxyacid dehydrogenase NAD-binding domain-containing protein n=1 Tax=Smittium simulii TaxID=133385 RepID=A0A2T9YBJ5_9FUNG|nr:hypothetical protein BB561_005194 [Smittium simulii]